jgi:hypothetical protein
MELLTSMLFLNMPPAVAWTLTAIVSIIVLHVILTTVLGFSTIMSLVITTLVVGGIIGAIVYFSRKS